MATILQPTFDGRSTSVECPVCGDQWILDETYDQADAALVAQLHDALCAVGGRALSGPLASPVARSAS